MTDIQNLEKYAKEITRQHLRVKGYRTFEHPSYKSAIVIVKDSNVLGMTNHSILRDNSSTTNILENEQFIPFEY